jgi:uncharacterized Ntn-hydrolase superfamily protein
MRIVPAAVPPVVAAALAAAAAPPAALAAPTPETIATFSIVGYDPATGELGVAVQSKFFAVGSVVPWAKANVGAVATQAFGNTTFGPRGLDLLAEGRAPDEVLDLLLADDPDAARRQVGVVDSRGRSAAFTGDECLPWAGHVSGPNFTAQGNILVGEETVRAMADAFRETDGMLGEKLMRALEAGQAAGGDSRGKQSAAILVVMEGGGYGGFNDRYCDLRVDDHAEPIRELRRLFDMWRIDALIRVGYQHVEAGEFEAAYRAGELAARLDPESGEPYFHRACYYGRGGEVAAALDQLRQAVERDPSLADRAKTDPDLGSLRDDPAWAEIVESD